MKWLFVFSTSLAMQCQSQKPLMGTTVILTKGETAEIKELDASFTLQGCGRESFFSDGKHEGEMAYCDIKGLCKGQPFQLSTHNNPVFLGTYQAKIAGINPWGREEKGLPAGACKIEISISPAVGFLQKYQWAVAQIVDEQPFYIPDTLTGIPLYHYSYATSKIGFSLESLHGQTVQLQKLQLEEKGRRSGRNVFAHIVIVDDRAITGWLSSTSMAPGIGALNMDKSGLNNW
ncbi:MAG: DUF4830 domain-containing protein [Bacteroidota bacterium]